MSERALQKKTLVLEAARRTMKVLGKRADVQTIMIRIVVL